MKMTVIVPTYRRPSDLCRCLEALKGQERPADQVLVTVREDDRETNTFLREYEADPLPLRIVRLAVPGVIAAMSAGLTEAEGEIIALTDDDTAPYPDWLARIEAHFAADPQVGGVGGRDWQPNDHRSRSVVGKVQWHGRVVGNHHLGVGEARAVDVLKGANCAYRAEPLKKIGFEQRLRGNGAQVHWELALGLAMRRAGWKLIYDPAVAMDHFIAQRFDEDANHRGFFSAAGLTNSVYNETLILLTYLPPLRRAAFLAWALLVGTWGEPGPLQVPRLLARRDKEVWGRMRATYAGRLGAVSAIVRGRRRSVQHEPTVSQTAR